MPAVGAAPPPGVAPAIGVEPPAEKAPALNPFPVSAGGELEHPDAK